MFVFAPVYWPGYKSGGPVRTLRNMVAVLHHEIDFRIFTADRDRGDKRAFSGVALNEWNDVEGARVFYADPGARTPPQMCRLVNAVAPDVVYINSFFDPVFSVRPFLLRWMGRMGTNSRWVLAPRGEFARSALARKRWKKLPFLAAARMLRLHHNLTWQASSEFEAADIRRTLKVDAERIKVAPDFTDVVAEPPTAREPHRPGSPLQVCFLSRVTPMKNLAFAIDALKAVRRPVRFDIFGPIADPTYWAACQRRLPKEEGNLDVRVHGEVPHADVRNVIARYDLFFLPTLGENFGHVILEALAAGVPVLISDRTPWRDLEARQVGWVRSLDDPRAFAEIIEAFADLDPDQKSAMAERAYRYAAGVARSPEVMLRNRELFLPAPNSWGKS